MTPEAIRAWCDEAANAATPNDIASRLNDALWRLRGAAEAIERRDAALRKVALGELSRRRDLSDRYPSVRSKRQG